LKCSCKEVFSSRHADIKNGRVYECPNCIFRRSQFYIGGKKFGRLSVQDKWKWITSPTNGKRFRHWWCVCECGKELWINAGSIIRSHTLSCGCFIQKNNSRYANETLYPQRHGLSGKKRDTVYARWTVLLSKCYNPKYTSYHNWGEEGYTVCEQWRNNYKEFHDWMYSQCFVDSLGIDIKEGKKEFSPDNCLLGDIKQIANRLRKKTHLKTHGIHYKGEVHTLKVWSEKLGIGYRSLANRWRACRDMHKCVDLAWKDGSGCHMRSYDVTDEKVRKMYEDGMTIAEIEDVLGTKAITHRLMKMGVKMRPRKYRSAVFHEKIIKECIERGDPIEKIMERCSYNSTSSLKRKVASMGYTI